MRADVVLTLHPPSSIFWKGEKSADDQNDEDPNKEYYDFYYHTCKYEISVPAGHGYISIGSSWRGFCRFGTYLFLGSSWHYFFGDNSKISCHASRFGEGEAQFSPAVLVATLYPGGHF